MKTETIAGKIVEYYDSIEDAPYFRFVQFGSGVLIDSGAGSDIDDIDKKLNKIIAKVKTDQKDEAIAELYNLRQGFQFVITGLSPKMLAFATLVKSIDGVECSDMTENGLNEVVKLLSNESKSVLYSIIARVKEKIFGEVAAFEGKQNIEVMRFYELLNEDTKAAIADMINGTNTANETKTKILAYGDPVKLFGKQGVGSSNEKAYLDLNLAVSKHFGKDLAQMTTKEALHAIKELKRQAKEAKRNNK